MSEDLSPRKIFTADAVKRGQLQALLSHSVFLEAVAIVEGEMEPRTGTQADAVPALAASLFHQVGGANRMLRDLRSLTKEVVSKPPPKIRALAKTADDLPNES